MQVKIFDTYSIGMVKRIDRNMVASLEDQVNRWFKDNPGIRVIHVKQSASGGSWGPIQLFVSVWYEPANNSL